MSSFKEKHHLTEANFLWEDSIELMDPRWIRYHPDSFLVIQELNSAKTIKIFDLKYKRIQEIVTRGKGPKEVISAWGIHIVGRDIYVYGTQLKKLLKLSLLKNRRFKVTDEIILNTGYIYSGTMNSDTNFITQAFDSESRLSFFNNNGKLIKEIGTFPLYRHDNKSKPNPNNVFLSTISSSPDGAKIVLGCEYTDLIEIYDMDKNQHQIIKGPFGHDFHVETVKSGNLTGQKVRPMLRAYRNAIASKDGFYIGYNGLFNEDKKQITESIKLIPKNIFYFSWDGKPLKHFELSYPFRSFDFNTNKDKLYCITLTPTPKIIVYDFSK